MSSGTCHSIKAGKTVGTLKDHATGSKYEKEIFIAITLGRNSYYYDVGKSFENISIAV